MEDIVGKIFPQSQGESLLVLQKSKEKNSSGAYLYKCEFQKYPNKILARKDSILKGNIINSRIEEEEFIGHQFLQKCGNTLTVLKKSLQKRGSSYLFEVLFEGARDIILADKNSILAGKVFDKSIEENFVGQIYKQNCGDSLFVIEKTKEKTKANSYYYRCKFSKYPCEILSTKYLILNGKVTNPKKEEAEEKIFINTIWPQNCGDSIKILQKTKQKSPQGNYLYKVTFLKYPYETLTLKSLIQKGQVDNLNLPWKSKEKLEEYLKDNFLNGGSLTEISQSLNINISTLGQAINNFNLTNYIKYTSLSENNIRKYIENILNPYQITISPKELFFKIQENSFGIDIFLEKEKIGIEYNGNYWHSEVYKEKNYHQQKSLKFSSIGIKIFHIFEYEWKEENKKEIILDILKNKLNIWDKIIYARKCIIKEINDKIYSSFVEKNHLQGSINTKIKLGLYYEEELVQVMSFSKSRFTNKYEWEMIRECSKIGYKIIGGKAKLFRFFVKKYVPKSIISYCDFSKFTGDSYLKLGFEFLKTTTPGFVWWDNKTNQTFWRNPYKHNELKYMKKIYDCGQLVFVWINK